MLASRDVGGIEKPIGSARPAEQVRQAVELEALCWEVERTALLCELRAKYNGNLK